MSEAVPLKRLVGSGAELDWPPDVWKREVQREQTDATGVPPPLLVFDEPDPQRVVVLDRLGCVHVQHASPATLVLRSSSPGRYTTGAPNGKLIAEDVGGADWLRDTNQHLARYSCSSSPRWSDPCPVVGHHRLAGDHPVQRGLASRAGLITGRWQTGFFRHGEQGKTDGRSFSDADRPVADARGAEELPLICRRNIVHLPPSPPSPLDSLHLPA